MRYFLLASIVLFLGQGYGQTQPAPDRKPATAAPAPKPLPPEFDAHMQAGHQLEAARQWAPAIVEFEAALRAAPDEPRALSELGWVAFLAGDLAKAKSANARALAASTTPQQKGAALYNAGRVAEAEKDFKAAADLYRQSVAARPNKEAQSRLNGITTPDKLIKSQGPYDSLKAMCPELKKSESRLDIDDGDGDEPKKPYTFKFTCDSERLTRLTAGLPPPLSEVVLFLSSALATNYPGRNHCADGCWTEVFLNVAVRVDKKWYLIADVDRGLSNGEKIQLLEAAVKPVGPSATKLLVVRLRVDTSLSNMFASAHDSLTVIGAGPSGLPSALPPVQTQSTNGVYPYGDDAKNEVSETHRDWRFEDGALVVYRETEIPDTAVKRKKNVTNLNERYLLAFP